MRFTTLPIGGDNGKQILAKREAGQTRWDRTHGPVARSTPDVGTAFGRTSLVEGLEDRRLLSVTIDNQGLPTGTAASNTAQPVPVTLPLATTYSGTVKYKKQAGQPATGPQAFVLAVESVAADGTVSGTVTSPSFGTESFVAHVQGKTFTATFDGAVDGSITGKLTGGGKKIQATLLNVTAGAKAKLVAVSQGAAGLTLHPAAVSGSTTTGSTTGGTGSDVTNTGGVGNFGVTVNSQSGILFDSNGELHFVDTYVGSTTLKISNEDFSGGQSSTTTSSYSVTLNVTSETSDDLLNGTMTAGDLGSYDVVGVVKGNEMTLIVTPGGTGTATGTQAGATTGGTGVLHLKVSADGRTYSGKFQQEANGVLGFGTVTLTRPNAVDGDLSGGSTAGAVSSAGGSPTTGSTGNTGGSTSAGSSSSGGSATAPSGTTGFSSAASNLAAANARSQIAAIIAANQTRTLTSVPVQFPDTTGTNGTGTTGTGTTGTGTIGGTVSGGTVGSGVLVPGTGVVGSGVGSVGSVGSVGAGVGLGDTGGLTAGDFGGGSVSDTSRPSA